MYELLISLSCNIFYRIIGLETSHGLLVVTPNNSIYVINGIRIISTNSVSNEKHPTSSRNKSVSYNNVSKPVTIGGSSVNAGSAVNSHLFEWLGDNSLYPDGLEGDLLQSWLQLLWKDLLDGNDSGFEGIGSSAYDYMAFNDIFSVFKRRHHLKYTALEMTDVHGYSILFSCSSVEVSEAIRICFLSEKNC